MAERISIPLVEALESRLLFSGGFAAANSPPINRIAPVAAVHAAQAHASEIAEAKAAKRAARQEAAQARRLARLAQREERIQKRALAAPAQPAPTALPAIRQEPALSDPCFHYQAFSSDPLFAPGGPSENDIIQGGIGDCYFLATLAAIARTDPNLIRNDITPVGNGDFEVAFHSTGRIVDEVVDDELPVTSTGNLAYAQIGQGGQGNSMWVAIMEKAYCAFRPGAGNSYAGIAAGWMDDAFSALGAVPIDMARASSGDALLAAIQNDLTADRAVTISIAQPADGAPLIGNHVYTVDSVDLSAPLGPTLTLRNPWGYAGAGADPTGSADITITAQQAEDSMSGVVSASV